MVPEPAVPVCWCAQTVKCPNPWMETGYECQNIFLAGVLSRLVEPVKRLIVKTWIKAPSVSFDHDACPTQTNLCQVSKGRPPIHRQVYSMGYRSRSLQRPGMNEFVCLPCPVSWFRHSSKRTQLTFPSPAMTCAVFTNYLLAEMELIVLTKVRVVVDPPLNDTWLYWA